MDDGMTVARARHPLAHMRGIKLFVNGISDEMSRQIKAADGDPDEGPLVRRCIERFASHHKLSRWDEEHLAAK